MTWGKRVAGMADRLFHDRRDAGRVLAGLLDKYKGRPDALVLALPRGGVPVGYEVATALGAPLDVFVVRKLGVPGHEELAMGAIASGGVIMVNEDVVRGLDIRPEVIQRVAESEGRELARRELAYREDRPVRHVAGLTVILVDDGLATGASMRAALLALRQQKPTRIVVGVPTAPEWSCRELDALAEEVVCATTPSPFVAVGASYWNFTQTTDDEVRLLLRAAATSAPPATAAQEPTEVATVRSAALPLVDGVPPDAALFELVGDARYVLIGEASHGTHEFYAARAAMTRRLIEEKGFCAVAVEADWPDAYRVNRYVRDRSADATAEEALRGFERFPTWMWRNTVVLDFVGWLRERNDRFGDDERAKAGFYGLDLYSLYRSIHEVISYLERVDPAAAEQARRRYACFDHASGGDGQAYGFAAAFGAGETCEQEMVDQLVDLQRHAMQYAEPDGLIAGDEHFYAEQNAKVVKASAEYYRTMFTGRTSSWNLRDRHMVDTLEALAHHLTRQRSAGSGPGAATDVAKIVVWAHNSHLGDARATELGSQGELNVGQLVRQLHDGGCRLVGFTGYTGTVTAADDWGGPAERKRVRPALPNSVEELLYEAREKAFVLTLGRGAAVDETLRSARLERAIGVIYRPETERQSHYFRARVAEQFDAVIHLDETRAVEPIERTAGWERGEVPETFPFAV
jgi:erythromycin esterase-like protein/predicted phosphoribosyltransferase